MKKFLSILMVSSIMVVGCIDDKDLENEINDLKERVAALEEWVTTVNSNITALQNIVTALQDMDYVTGGTEGGVRCGG